MEQCENSSQASGIIMFILCVLLVLIMSDILSGCTYSITMVHTQGEASDVVDETATNSPSTHLSVPVSVIPKPVM